MEHVVRRLENKVAIITGGAGSIGKTTAKLFLEQGAKVFLVDLDEDSLKKVVDELGSKNLKYSAADVTKPEDVKRYVTEAVNAFGTIDVFFNNAGIEGVVKPTVDYPEEVFDKVLAVNVKGVFLGNKYVLPNMNNGGSIILTSSVAGIAGSLNVTAYIASKHAVVGMMRNLALEVAPRNIRVNTINPSPVDNRMMRSLEAGYNPDDAAGMKKAFENSIPLGRYADPIEIAQLVQFLASDESKFITGTTQVIDGGMNA
ncbi:MAG: oxidoreductase [Xanthomarina sp.]|uniref:SDR family NAD(P)-dependent oxidoreductase n=1 Tax=Xanthomarina sp. TaxID=1931211 RepID=UPI000C4453D9|nr:SDR family oxidoreductase [Xanthomarina sp.]MAL23010.1 oxidoreductase [Xanthomarina sp.]MBF62461.1 oxidoreductase [Xanthomarina sp.]HAB26888.1 oxidoreductase [Xanthomarina gelatinilytica]|tara:strand:- start:1136 stop:1906 length:771 start_codon:yes stop_codon:yes gene_type:complete